VTPAGNDSSENERREKNGRKARREGARSDWVKFASSDPCLTVDLYACSRIATSDSVAVINAE